VSENESRRKKKESVSWVLQVIERGSRTEREREREKERERERTTRSKHRSRAQSRERGRNRQSETGSEAVKTTTSKHCATARRNMLVCGRTAT